MTIHAQPRRRVTALDDPPPLGQLPSVRIGAVLWGGLALLVTATSVGMTPRTPLLAGGIAFLLVDGFVVHRDGVLRYDGSADLLRLALLVGVGLLAPWRAHRGK